MRYIVFVLCVLSLGCGSTRVLVKNCQEAGPGLENCELIQKL